MIMKIRYETLGGHIHCAVFTAPGRDRTFAKCGDLAFSVEEFPEVKLTFSPAVVWEERA